MPSRERIIKVGVQAGQIDPQLKEILSAISGAKKAISVDFNINKDLLSQQLHNLKIEAPLPVVFKFDKPALEQGLNAQLRTLKLDPIKLQFDLGPAVAQLQQMQQIVAPLRSMLENLSKIKPPDVKPSTTPPSTPSNNLPGGVSGAVSTADKDFVRALRQRRNELRQLELEGRVPNRADTFDAAFKRKLDEDRKTAERFAKEANKRGVNLTSALESRAISPTSTKQEQLIRLAADIQRRQSDALTAALFPKKQTTVGTQKVAATPTPKTSGIAGTVLEADKSFVNTLRQRRAELRGLELEGGIPSQVQTFDAGFRKRLEEDRKAAEALARKASQKGINLSSVLGASLFPTSDRDQKIAERAAQIQRENVTGLNSLLESLSGKQPATPKTPKAPKAQRSAGDDEIIRGVAEFSATQSFQRKQLDSATANLLSSLGVTESIDSRARKIASAAKSKGIDANGLFAAFGVGPLAPGTQEFEIIQRASELISRSPATRATASTPPPSLSAVERRAIRAVGRISDTAASVVGPGGNSGAVFNALIGRITSNQNLSQELRDTITQVVQSPTALQSEALALAQQERSLRSAVQSAKTARQNLSASQKKALGIAGAARASAHKLPVQDFQVNFENFIQQALTKNLGADVEAELRRILTGRLSSAESLTFKEIDFKQELARATRRAPTPTIDPAERRGSEIARRLAVASHLTGQSVLGTGGLLERTVGASTLSPDVQRVVNRFFTSPTTQDNDLLQTAVTSARIQAQQASARRQSPGSLRADQARALRLQRETEEFRESFSEEEFFARIFKGRAAQLAVRQKRAEQLEVDKAFPGLSTHLIQDLNTTPGAIPSLFSLKNFKDPKVLGQLGFSTVFGGIPGAAVGALAAATPLGAAGVLAASTIQQGVSALFEPILSAIKQHQQEFEESGLAFQKSILGISAVLQSTTQVATAAGQAVSLPTQLKFQEQRGREIQLAARGQLLPLGIAGSTESTFVQGIVSSLASRGFVANPKQIGRIAELVGGPVLTQRPQLLENTTLLLRDLQDFLTGGPQAQRVLIGQLAGLRQAAPGIREARGIEDIIRALEPAGAFAAAAKGSDNISAIKQRLAGAKDNLDTAAGIQFFEALKPALLRTTEVLQEPATLQAFETLGTTLGELAKLSANTSIEFGKLGIGITNFTSKLVESASDVATGITDGLGQITAEAVSSILQKAVPAVGKALDPGLKLTGEVGKAAGDFFEDAFKAANTAKQIDKIFEAGDFGNLQATVNPQEVLFGTLERFGIERESITGFRAEQEKSSPFQKLDVLRGARSKFESKTLEEITNLNQKLERANVDLATEIIGGRKVTKRVFDKDRISRAQKNLDQLEARAESQPLSVGQRELEQAIKSGQPSDFQRELIAARKELKLAQRGSIRAGVREVNPARVTAAQKAVDDLKAQITDKELTLERLTPGLVGAELEAITNAQKSIRESLGGTPGGASAFLKLNRQVFDPQKELLNKNLLNFVQKDFDRAVKTRAGDPARIKEIDIELEKTRKVIGIRKQELGILNIEGQQGSENLKALLAGPQAKQVQAIVADINKSNALTAEKSRLQDQLSGKFSNEAFERLINLSLDIEQRIFEERKQGLQLTQEANQDVESLLQTITGSFDAGTGIGQRGITAAQLDASLKKQTNLQVPLAQATSDVEELTGKIADADRQINALRGLGVLNVEDTEAIDRFERVKSIFASQRDVIQTRKQFLESQQSTEFTKQFAAQFQEKLFDQTNPNNLQAVKVFRAGIDNGTIAGRRNALDADFIEAQLRLGAISQQRETARASLNGADVAKKRAAEQELERLDLQERQIRASLPGLNLSRFEAGKDVGRNARSLEQAVIKRKEIDLDEITHRKQLNDAIKASSAALGAFNDKLKEAVIGKEGQLLAAVKRAQASGNVLPDIFNNEDFVASVERNVSASELNSLSRSLGIGNLTSGGEGPIFLPTGGTGSFQNQLAKEQDDLRTTIAKSELELKKLPLSIADAVDAIESTIRRLRREGQPDALNPKTTPQQTAPQQAALPQLPTGLNPGSGLLAPFLPLPSLPALPSLPEAFKTPPTSTTDFVDQQVRKIANSSPSPLSESSKNTPDAGTVLIVDALKREIQNLARAVKEGKLTVEQMAEAVARGLNKGAPLPQ